MKYLYEMHLHTSEVSGCSKISATEAIKLYLDKGYKGIVVTDHFYSGGYERFGNGSWDKYISSYVSGYKLAKESAPEGFNVLLGLEIRFPANDNDYLVYGVSEELLRANPFMYDTKPKKFKAFCDENNLLFLQAHPFRTNMTIVNPAYLHGVEVANYNQRHASRNFLATAYAEKFGLIQTSGSDFHEYEDLALGGIYFEDAICSEEQLVKVLKSRKYELKLSANPHADE